MKKIEKVSMGIGHIFVSFSDGKNIRINMSQLQNILENMTKGDLLEMGKHWREDDTPSLNKSSGKTL